MALLLAGCEYVHAYLVTICFSVRGRDLHADLSLYTHT